MINIYLASRYSEHPTMREWRNALHASSLFNVTSRWIEGSHEMSDGSDNRVLNRRFAEEDLEDLEAADVLIVDSRKHLHGQARGGRHVEFGWALGTSMPIVLIGEPENVFHYMVPRTYPTIEAFLVSIMVALAEAGNSGGYNKEVIKNLALSFFYVGNESQL